MKSLFVGLLFILILPVIVVMSQTDDCPVEADSALTTASEICVGTERNQVCYGNNDVNLVPYRSVDLNFDSPGDIAEVNNIQALSLSALDKETGSWGIAIMRLLANLDPSTAEDVTVLLFGDVELEDAIGYQENQSIISNNYVNMRRLPNSDAPVMDSIAKGDAVDITGTLEDNSWVRAVNPETNVSGWIFASLLSEIDFDGLSIVSAYEPYFAPMQAFYFESGARSSACSSVPRDGMIVQTPEGLRRVTLWINEVTIDFLPGIGSTAVIQSDDDETTSISILEGSAHVGSGTEGYLAVVGSSVNVNRKMNGGSVSISKPTSTNNDKFTNLPFASLVRAIEMPNPATDDAINEANNPKSKKVVTDEADNNDDASDGETSDDSDMGNVDCPDNSCNVGANEGDTLGDEEVTDCPIVVTDETDNNDDASDGETSDDSDVGNVDCSDDSCNMGANEDGTLGDEEVTDCSIIVTDEADNNDDASDGETSDDSDIGNVGCRTDEASDGELGNVDCSDDSCNVEANDEDATDCSIVVTDEADMDDASDGETSDDSDVGNVDCSDDSCNVEANEDVTLGDEEVTDCSDDSCNVGSNGDDTLGDEEVTNCPDNSCNAPGHNEVGAE